MSSGRKWNNNTHELVRGHNGTHLSCGMSGFRHFIRSIVKKVLCKFDATGNSHNRGHRGGM
jgi:hypothetical protein